MHYLRHVYMYIIQCISYCSVQVHVHVPVPVHQMKTLFSIVLSVMINGNYSFVMMPICKTIIINL